MIRLGNLDKWQPLADGQVVAFTGLQRTVILEVNSASPTGLYVTGEAYPGPVLVALVNGRDKVEFAVDGDFELQADGGDLWFYTADGVQTASPPSDDAVIFTRIANRKARNPNLEMMEFRMNQNLNRRLKELDAEAERRLQDMERKYAAGRTPRTPVEQVTDQAVESGATAEDAERAEDAARARDADDPKSAKGSKPGGSKKAPDGVTDN